MFEALKVFRPLLLTNIFVYKVKKNKHNYKTLSIRRSFFQEKKMKVMRAFYQVIKIFAFLCFLKIFQKLKVTN